MKRSVCIVLVLLIVLSLATPGYCYGPIRKLGRGICNLLTWPFEIPYRIMETNKSSGTSAAITIGIWNGACSMIMRFFFGVYEVATFPVPIPAGYEPCLKDPEFLLIK